MTAFKLISVTFLLIGFNHLLFSQIRITSPQNRAVYQRDGSGFSKITIAGSYQQQVDKVEFRLIPVEAGQGDVKDWTTIKALPLNGNFSAVVSVKEGWYSLELRGSLNGNIIGDAARLDRVGVGEVFIIAGQSNAEGADYISGLGAANDRVNCFEGQNGRSFGGTDYISLSPFTKLNANTRIAPRGVNAWCWGRVGDLLVSRLNVPVMFFNVGFNGTTSNSWAVSANGGLASNPYVGGVYANRLPYQNMLEVLQYFTAQLGIRAILWCQGEADNYIGNGKQITNVNVYKSNLQTVINRTRDDAGKNISWVVSLTSAIIPCEGCFEAPFAPSDNNILEAQRATIRETNNVFQGPETDGIQNPGRQDGVHFNSGLSQVAEAWSNSLNSTFFQNSIPHLPITIPDLTFKCGNNQMEIALPDGNNSYEWSNNGQSFDNGRFSNQQKVIINIEPNRQYFARFKDNKGNVTQVPAISFRGSNIPVSQIIANGATEFCEGGKILLKANDAAIYEWSNGNKSQEITVSSSGNYAVRTVSQFGCQSNFSTPQIITAKPNPPKPSILINGNTVFCADTNTILQSSNQNAADFRWSNGFVGKNLKVNASGNYTVTTISDKGCLSPESDAIKITVNPLPSTPSIVPNGSTTFCADTNVTLSSSNQDVVSYRWNSGLTTRNITVKNAGDYSVRTIDKNGCISLTSASTRIKVNALPPIPTFSSTQDTVFCQGESTILGLKLTTGGFPTWVANEEGKVTTYNFENLNVSKTGSFQGFQTDLNGCKSGFTPSIMVSVKPLPPKVENIVRLSPYTVGIENPKSTQYFWQVDGADKFNFQGNTVRFNKASKFRVIAKNIYKTQSYGDKVCVSEPSNEFAFELFDDKGVSIYPNPSKGIFKIDVRSEIDWQNSTIDVYNLLGEVIQKGFITSFGEVKTLDLSTLPDGEYMLRIKTNSFFTITKRILIER